MKEVQQKVGKNLSIKTDKIFSMSDKIKLFEERRRNEDLQGGMRLSFSAIFMVVYRFLGRVRGEQSF